MKTLSLFILSLLTACSSTTPSREPSSSRYCKPSESCWPSPSDWKELEKLLVGKLVEPKSPLPEAGKNTRNPYYLEDQVGGTQNRGWLGAWTAAQSTYAVVAESPGDIVAAVNFARAKKIRLVIKGTGHDYLGRSNAPDSLLVWTHKLRKIATQPAFVARGCAKQTAVPAVTLEAGTRWLEAYQEVTGKNGRYVQGGGCTSVGAAGGFLQGGGFGSWSKKFGTAASNLLEAEVVTADGKLIVANACQNHDLFWALRGGGGGTFGIVTRVTMRTHALPKTFGWINGRVIAKSEEAYKALLLRFVHFYRETLSNERWGEQVRLDPQNTIELAVSFQGLTKKEAEKIWEPFRRWVTERPESYTLNARVDVIPGAKMWDADFIRRNFPKAIENETRPGEPKNHFWWSGGDAGQVSSYWYTYQSRWIPAELFDGAKASTLADAFFQASRHWPFELHLNKGQAGASPDAVRRGLETSMNPALYKAAALLIAGSYTDGEPDPKRGELQKAHASAAMEVIRKISPGAGSYVNETDYFEPNWREEFWGTNYSKLLEIKRKYDPEKMFTCHHCVGSED